MNPVNPSAAGSSGGAPQSQAPAAPATAPSTDFLLLLAQIVGEPAKQAITPVVTGANGFRLDGGSENADGAEDALSAESLALLPISLPVAVSPGSAGIAGHLASANNGALAAATSAALSAQSAVAAGAQMLSDMIQVEQAATRDAASALDSLQLPSSDGANKAGQAADAMLARPVHTPVGSAQWANEIGARLTMMAEQGKHSASLRLSPEHLGPLEIRIAIRDDQASVWFGAAHADTRAAIEHALPRLRELFESQGMFLADAGVFQEAPQDQSRAQLQDTGAGFEAATGEQPGTQAIEVTLGLVDAYA